MPRPLIFGALIATATLCGASRANAAAITIFDPGINSELAIRWGSGGGSAFNNDFAVVCPGATPTGDASNGSTGCAETAAGLSFSGTFNSPHHAQLGTFNANFYEFDGGPLSDILTFTLSDAGGGVVSVTGFFQSDVDGGPALQPLLNACTIVEQLGGTNGCVVGPPSPGSPQSFAFQTGNSAGPSDFSLVATSDAEPVPEPASLLLVGSGLIGAAVSIRRRLHATSRP